MESFDKPKNSPNLGYFFDFLGHPSFPTISHRLLVLKLIWILLWGYELLRVLSKLEHYFWYVKPSNLLIQKDVTQTFDGR